MTNPENGTTSYNYNADGTMNTKTDAKGQVLSYFYDSLGRLTQVKNGGVVLRTFTYDANGWGQNLAGRVARVDYGGGKWSELYSYHPAGGRTAKRLSYTYGQSTQNLDAFWSYNTAGQVTGVKYPDTTILDSYANPQVVTGDTFTNSFDPMGRPKDLTIAPGDGSTPYQQAQGATYGPSGELTSVSYVGAGGYIYESRSYNARMQLTGLSALGAYYSIASIGYNYYDVAAGQQPDTTKNNSKVGQMSSTILGSTEVVNYKYDSLNRLIAAYTNDTSSVGWGLAWDYDGFGNRLSQTVTQGTAQPMTTGVDQTTNRIGGTYDANGNMTNGGAYTYDVENRMIGGSNPYVASDEYDYAPDNKRIYKKTTNNSGTTEYVYFYSGSKKLATYQIGYYGSNNSQFLFIRSSTNIYFGGKLIQAEDAPVVTDRLGTVIWDQVKGGHKYFPYGEERTSTTNESTKFGTYFRDGTTGLDYAVNRYFNGAMGRFMSPDPRSSSSIQQQPGSWNKFSYANDDPVNLRDPLGLESYGPEDDEDPDPDPTPNPPGPQPPQPKPFDPAPIMKTALDDAVNGALERLRDNEHCSSLFNLGDHYADPVTLLEELYKGNTDYGLIRYGQISQPSIAATAESIINPPTSNNPVGVIVTLNNQLLGAFIGASEENRIQTILHELGHAYQFIFGAQSTMINRDNAETPEGRDASQKNSNLIALECER